MKSASLLSVTVRPIFSFKTLYLTVEADCYNCFNASQSISGSLPIGLQ